MKKENQYEAHVDQKSTIFLQFFLSLYSSSISTAFFLAFHGKDDMFITLICFEQKTLYKTSK